MEAVAIYGQPGAGKGTQANLLAWLRGYIHFDTGKELEMMLLNYTGDDPVILGEKEIFKSGKLNTPDFVLKLVREKAEEIAKAGLNIVFSGSPRTMFEAFGDSKNRGLIEILEKAYGKDHVHFLFLKVDPKSSISRNVSRMICSSCKTPVMGLYYSGTSCPLCGGELKKRVLDNAETMKKRLEEFENRTRPIMEELKKRGYKISEIDGEPLPYIIHQEICKALIRQDE